MTALGDVGPGAYVHVPYCAHRCTYCSFVALTERDTEGAYFNALRREIAARRGEVPGPLGSVYFGGGTPSFVAPERLAAVLAALSDAFGLAPDAEVTAEANPDDLDDVRIDALHRLGVGRLSVGVQSLDDRELVHLERRHDAAAARSALRRAVERFGNVSGDLMIGIPEQTAASLEKSVDGLLEAGVSHLSVYLLEIEKAPRLVTLKRERPELFPDDDASAEMWEEVDRRATAAGLRRYEFSNWAVPGRESRHNLKYWTRTPTLGFGVSAHSFDGVTRRANSGALVEYVRRVTDRGAAFVSEFAVRDVEALRERALLGLRISEGIPEADYDAARETLEPADRERLGDAESAGLVRREAGRIRLTPRGVLLSNEVLSAFV